MASIPPENMLARLRMVIPGGVNSATRRLHRCDDLTIAGTRGSYFTTADERESVDFQGAFRATLLGHNDPDVNAALALAAQRTDLLGFGVSTEEAQPIVELLPSAERVLPASRGDGAIAPDRSRPAPWRRTRRLRRRTRETARGQGCAGHRRRPRSGACARPSCRHGKVPTSSPSDTDATIDTVPYQLSGSEDLPGTIRLAEEGRLALSATADVRSQAISTVPSPRGFALFGQVDCLIANAGIDTGMIHWQAAYDLVTGRPSAGTPEDMVRGGYHFHVLPEGPIDPEVCARVALFLNSDLASVVTGVAIPVEGRHLLLGGYNNFAVVPD